MILGDLYWNNKSHVIQIWILKPILKSNVIEVNILKFTFKSTIIKNILRNDKDILDFKVIWRDFFIINIFKIWKSKLHYILYGIDNTLNKIIKTFIIHPKPSKNSLQIKSS